MDGAIQLHDRSIRGEGSEWGGHMLVECDDPATVHKVCSTFPVQEAQAVMSMDPDNSRLGDLCGSWRLCDENSLRRGLVSTA
jgi:hypothetical protein